MNLSKLIDHLQEQLDKRGDCEVFIVRCNSERSTYRHDIEGWGFGLHYADDPEIPIHYLRASYEGDKL